MTKKFRKEITLNENLIRIKELTEGMKVLLEVKKKEREQNPNKCNFDLQKQIIDLENRVNKLENNK